MSKEQRQAWLDRADDVAAGCREGMVCPVCGEETLGAIEVRREDRVEYTIHCSNCGARNYLLGRYPSNPDPAP